MWLVYLRFDDQGQVKTYHVRTGSKQDVAYLLSLVERHGLTPTERIVEYAAFAVSGVVKVKPMLVPNFHFYDGGEFVWRWDAVERGIPLGTKPPTLSISTRSLLNPANALDAQPPSDPLSGD